MQVIIAEKPSVAREIAAIVGATNRKDGFIEGNGYAVTWAFGHLVGLAMPQQYGIAGFRRENLPILPSSFILLPRQVREGKEYKADPGVVKQLGILRELFGMAERIIVATDAGREGELIFRYIYSYLECRTPFVRLWISSLTDRAIREGLQHLRPGNEYDNLYLSAKARSEADWIVGINASQALAVAAGRGVWSLGRVQTPTLAIICSRYLENKAFKPATYFRLKLSTAKEDTEFTVLSTEKFDGREKAEAARAEVIGARTVRVVNVERKEAREQPPLLYDLTTLQKEANSRYGFSAEKTLDIAQSLYEKKFITYPRTGSRYISEDVAEEIPALIGNMTRYPRFAEYAGRMDTASLSRRSVDNEKIADHHALLPTENLPSELDADHRIVYEMVAGRMLETFSGACVKENTSLTLQSAGHDFMARGSIMVETGWRAVLNESVEEKEEDMTLLPDIVQGDELPVKGCVTEQKQTRPRPLHTESSLLAAMETAGRELSDEAEREAMKDAGIGGVLPGPKVNSEIARVRDVPEGRTVISPPYHREFSTPRELVLFIARMRELSGGKPTGFKLCPGSRRQFLAVCKAMLEEGTAPDFIIVDGAEGGTGAAPLEFADHVGTPLTEGLLTVHNALVGAGLRDRIRIGASGKIATGTDLVKRLLQGADYGNAARAMMFAVGCIQAQRCHTNTCPTGVTTQDPRRARALDVGDKTLRVQRLQEATVARCLARSSMRRTRLRMSEALSMK